MTLPGDLRLNRHHEAFAGCHVGAGSGAVGYCRAHGLGGRIRGRRRRMVEAAANSGPPYLRHSTAYPGSEAPFARHINSFDCGAFGGEYRQRLIRRFIDFPRSHQRRLVSAVDILRDSEHRDCLRPHPGRCATTVELHLMPELCKKHGKYRVAFLARGDA